MATGSGSRDAEEFGQGTKIHVPRKMGLDKNGFFFFFSSLSFNGNSYKKREIHIFDDFSKFQLIVVEADCPRMRAAVAETYKNESERSDVQLRDYYKKLETITGQKMKTITDVELLYNTLEIEVTNPRKKLKKRRPWKIIENVFRNKKSNSLKLFYKTRVFSGRQWLDFAGVDQGILQLGNARHRREELCTF